MVYIITMRKNSKLKSVKHKKSSHLMIITDEIMIENEGDPLKKLKTESNSNYEVSIPDLTYTFPGKKLKPSVSAGEESVSHKDNEIDLAILHRKSSANSDIEIAKANRHSPRPSQNLIESNCKFLDNVYSSYNGKLKPSRKDSLKYPKLGTEFGFNDEERPPQSDWPYSSFESLRSPKNESFHERMDVLRTFYSTLSNKDILYHGALYVQSLAKRQKDFSKADENIENYFERRKEGLSRLLDKF